MKTVTLEVASREEVSRRALKAFKGKKQGTRISFATPELLWKVLTAKRWELLKAMAGQGPLTIREVSRLLHASIAYAMAPRQEELDYAMQFGRGLDRAKADRFVGMYVNELTLEYGDRGRAAVRRLLDEAWEKRLIPKQVVAEFSA